MSEYKINKHNYSDCSVEITIHILMSS